MKMNGAPNLRTLIFFISLLPQFTVQQNDKEYPRSPTQNDHNYYIQSVYIPKKIYREVKNTYIYEEPLEVDPTRSKIYSNNNTVIKNSSFLQNDLYNTVNSIKTLGKRKSRFKRSFLKDFIRNRESLIPLSFQVGSNHESEDDEMKLSHSQPQATAVEAPRIYSASNSRNTFIQAKPEKNTFQDLILTKLQFIRDTASTLQYLGNMGDFLNSRTPVRKITSYKPRIQQSIPKTKLNNVPNVNVQSDDHNEITESERLSTERIRHLIETNQLSLQIKRQKLKPKINVINSNARIDNAPSSNTTLERKTLLLDSNSTIKNETTKQFLNNSSALRTQENEIENVIIRRNTDNVSIDEGAIKPNRIENVGNETSPSGFFTQVYNGLTRLPVIGNVFRASVDPLYRPLLHRLNPQILDSKYTNNKLLIILILFEEQTKKVH